MESRLAVGMEARVPVGSLDSTFTRVLARVGDGSVDSSKVWGCSAAQVLKQMVYQEN